MSDKRHELPDVKEVITVRGLAAAIQALSTPTFRNVRELLHKLGWKLIPEQSNKQTNHD